MRILLFIDQNTKTIPWEVPLRELKAMGHNIYLLTILQHGPIHQEYTGYGFEVHAMNQDRVSLKKIFGYAIKLRRFCRQHRIDVVHAHLSIPCMAGVLAQGFITAKVFCFRHHYNFVNLAPNTPATVSKADRIMDWLIARGARKLILPSKYLKELIEENEGVPAQKMLVIPYAYNWQPVLKRAVARAEPPTGSPLRLLMISRLAPLKRPELALDLLQAIRQKGRSATLTIVGIGPLAEELKKKAEEMLLIDNVRFEGFQKDVVPYFNTADVLVHPSVTEASSSVIKEAGVLGCPVVVCAGVGDFDDYLVHHVNGWRINAANFVEEAAPLLVSLSHSQQQQVGQALRKTVMERFALSPGLIQAYLSLK